MRTIFFLIMIVVSSVSNAVTMKQYLDAINAGETNSTYAYENGLVEMLMAYGAQIRLANQPELFCLPDDLSLDRVLIRNMILKSFEANGQKEKLVGTTPPSFFLLPAMVLSFPCK